MPTAQRILEQVFDDHFRVGKRFRVGQIVKLLQNATTEEVMQNIAERYEGYSVATEEHLRGYDKTWNTDSLKKFQSPIVALGSIGPGSCSGNPTLMPEGKIISLGIPGPKLEWSKDTHFLLVRGDIVVNNRSEIIEFLERAQQIFNESTPEIIIDENDGEGEKTIWVYGAKKVEGGFQCTFRYKGEEEPVEGMIPFSAFKKMTV